MAPDIRLERRDVQVTDQHSAAISPPMLLEPGRQLAQEIQLVGKLGVDRRIWLVAAGREPEALAGLESDARLLAERPKLKYDAVIARQLARARVALAAALLGAPASEQAGDAAPPAGPAPKIRALAALDEADAWCSGGAPVDESCARRVTELRASAKSAQG